MRFRSGVPACLVLFVATAALTACDGYSVLAQFSRGGPLSLAIENSSLVEGQTISLYPTGGVAPYSFALVAGNLYSAGTGLGSINSSNQTFTAGSAIGTFDVVVTDSTGASASSAATIVPPTPGSFTAVADTTTLTITLSWTYTDASAIGGFQIWRSYNGGSFSLLTTAASTATGYSYTPRHQGHPYTYYIVAAAGSFDSAPTPEQSATT